MVVSFISPLEIVAAFVLFRFFKEYNATYGMLIYIRVTLTVETARLDTLWEGM